MEGGWYQNALHIAVLLAVLGARRGSVLLAAPSRHGGLPVCDFARWQCWNTLAQEQQENYRVLLLCLLELSPQQGSDSRYLYCCVPFYPFCSPGLVYFKNLRG